MVYFKSFCVGVIVAIVTATLWILVSFVVPLVGPFLLDRVTGAGGMSAAIIDSNSILLAGLIGFAAGFGWMLRRERRLLLQQ